MHYIWGSYIHGAVDISGAVVHHVLQLLVKHFREKRFHMFVHMLVMFALKLFRGFLMDFEIIRNCFRM
jgi:hypothetical protein